MNDEIYTLYKQPLDLEFYQVNVLLVDDQPIIAEAVRRFLADEEDIEFHYCQDPANAIKMASEIRPTLILQDLVMPEIDGLTLVRYFRANPTTRIVPIIVLSSKEDPKVKSEAFSTGANDYLVKLPDKIELVARIRYHSRAYVNQIQRDEAFRALKKLSVTDPLTCLSNRRCFHEFLEREWQRGLRNKTPLGIVLCDIDFFKLYNDNYGHQQGDVCLKNVATTLKKALLRLADLVARYGGEEFVAVLPDTDEKGAVNVARRMKSNVEALGLSHAASRITDHVTISIGAVSAVPTNEFTADLLVFAADKALYEAKENGRNRVEIGTLEKRAGILKDTGS